MLDVDVRRFVHQERDRPAGRLRAGRFELIKQNEPAQPGFLVAAIDLNRLGGSGEPPLAMESIESIRKQKRPAGGFQLGALN